MSTRSFWPFAQLARVAIRDLDLLSKDDIGRRGLHVARPCLPSIGVDRVYGPPPGTSVGDVRR